LYFASWGVELGERRSQPALYPRGERFLARFPVERHKLTEFVGALDHVLQRFRYQPACAFAPRKFTHQEERHVTKLHRVASFPRDRRYILGLVACHKFGNALCNVIALLVERVFPEQAAQHGAQQLSPRVDLLRHRPFLGSRRKHALPNVKLHHLLHSSFLPAWSSLRPHQ